MIELRNRVLLAPMSGITDLPFRRLAHRLGAGLVVAEMVASKMLAKEHRQTMQRVMGAGELSPYVIQIAGREPHETAEAAKVAADLGADVIDINMGCPARKVIKGVAGSALMRHPDLALSIIDSVVRAVDLPVSLKMRLGWDENLLNAPQIAQGAEQAGIQMITVHGRTRNQFYKGQANWRAIRDVVEATDIAIIANGDILTYSDVENCLDQSTAYGVMIGRGAQGRPWIVGDYGAKLANEIPPNEPSLRGKKQIVLQHYEDMLSFYGCELGLCIARKHLGWYAKDLLKTSQRLQYWRSNLCREQNPKQVIKMISAMFQEHGDHMEIVA